MPSIRWQKKMCYSMSQNFPTQPYFLQKTSTPIPSQPTPTPLTVLPIIPATVVPQASPLSTASIQQPHSPYQPSPEPSFSSHDTSISVPQQQSPPPEPITSSLPVNTSPPLPNLLSYLSFLNLYNPVHHLKLIYLDQKTIILCP